MMNKTDRTVEGFCYVSEEEALLAASELEKREVLEKKLLGADIVTIKSVYERAIMNRTFRTPAGYAFLTEMREKLLSAGISESEITPIPLQVHFITKSALQISQESERAAKDKTKDIKETKKAPHISILLNVVLVIMVILMFFITLWSDNPNILNYKNKIINDYSEWEQNLKDKEDYLRSWALEHGVDY